MDDNELIRKAQGGDTNAFEELVYRHDRSVLSIAARYVLSADEAKDIYQEVFLRVYRGLKGFRFQSEFATWLHRITVNVCLSYKASNRSYSRPRRHEDEGEDESHAEGDVADPADGPDASALRSEISRRVEEALGTLAPKHRMVFSLRHLEGYSLKEIAGMMDCTEGTVKRYLFDATRKMRGSLRDLT